jgi:acid-sensing ion channel, other
MEIHGLQSIGQNRLKVLSKDPHPLKASSREGQGLKLFLTPNKNIDQKVASSLSFTIHSPHELPGSYDLFHYILFDYGFDFEILITPEITRTDDTLRSLVPAKRGCYFPGERKLEYFQVYSRRNCEFECYSKAVNEAEIHCVPYYAVRDNDTEVCDYRKDYELKRLTLMGAGRNCHCLDECDSIRYKTEIISHSLINKSEATLEFKFKNIGVVPLRRYQTFTFSDFLAQSGGILGLLAGISMLSVVEICYFLSLRWIVNCWRLLKRKLK